MIKINLLETTKEKETRSTVMKAAPPVSSMVVVGAVIVALGLLVVVVWWWQKHSEYAKSQDELVQARTEREQLKPFIDEVDKYEKRKNLWAAKRDAIDKLRKDRNMPVHILDEVTKNLPQFLWLDQMEYKEGIINVKGHCTNKLDPSTFVSNLEASDFFGDVKLISVDLETTQQGESYRFEINAKVENPFQQKKTDEKSAS